MLERLESIREALALSQRRVLQILGRLRTGTVEDLGLEASVERLVEFWTSRHSGLKVHTAIPEGGVGAELDPVIYRVIQESMSNAVRHGNPTAIDATVTSDGNSIRVRVVDDGGGLKSNRSGHGLTGMRERVSSKQGAFVVKNRDDGKGTLVEASFPKSELQTINSESLRAGSGL